MGERLGCGASIAAARIAWRSVQASRSRAAEEG
jgi:hypothetical protein